MLWCTIHVFQKSSIRTFGLDSHLGKFLSEFRVEVMLMCRHYDGV